MPKLSGKTTPGLLLALAFLTSCGQRPLSTARQPGAPAPLPERQSYVDLQPGWRISVITPVLKPGSLPGQALAGEAQITGTDASLSITLNASPDFVGYERSIYTVEPSRNAGVRIRFVFAETYRDGKPTAEVRPRQELFRLPGQARRVRLVYLLRASRADHNMALLAARTQTALEEITLAVQNDPAACVTSSTSVCQWIPPGVAVRPESQRPGSSDWAPVR